MCLRPVMQQIAWKQRLGECVAQRSRAGSHVAGQRRLQLCARLHCIFDQGQDDVVRLVCQHVAQIPLDAAGQLLRSRLGRGIQICAGVDCLEDAQVGAEVVDERPTFVGVVLGLDLDRAVKALQPLARDACAAWTWLLACGPR